MRRFASGPGLGLLLLACGLQAADGERAAPATASLPKTWAFRPVVRPGLPPVQDAGWPRLPADAFILAALEARGWRPSPQADPAALLRRVAFDLTGLPPAPADVDDFIADPAPDAFERAADRLLASPRHGERWARHWLDVVRFAESHGFEWDRLRETAWPYRDYVIASLNADKPYDAFVREQLAGDAIEGASDETVVATGFLVAGPWDQAGYTSASALLKERIREDELEDMLAAVGQTFLGVSLQCARCHDHKFDPLPQEDYYRFKAALQGVRHGERELRTKDDARAPPVLGTLRLPGKVYAAVPGPCEPTHVLVRGDVEQRKALVSAGGLAAVAAPPSSFALTDEAPEAVRRLRLAEWIASPRNPLTARVIVNRLWQYHFGRGIVATPSDLGAAGERPTHPELLDWLAAELVAGGWSLKRIHRQIVLSSTYRQGGSTGPAAAADAEDRWLWKFPLRRLEAEAIRDTLLELGGTLDLRLGGPSFRPFTVTASGSNFYHLTDDDGPDGRRRSVYRMVVQGGKDPLLDVLDCPDASTKTPVRAVTTTPLQSLSLMNSAFVQRQAAAFAARLRAGAGDSADGQVRLGFRLALGREPRPGEAAPMAALVREHGLESFTWALFNASELLHVP